MSRRRSPSGISRQPRPKAAPSGVQPGESGGRGSTFRQSGEEDRLKPGLQRRTRLWDLLLFAALVAVAGWVIYLMWTDHAASPAVTGSGEAASHKVTDEELLCQRFAKLHNAGDPAAAGLLGRVPEVPGAPVTSEEAGRLQADFFLRQPIEVLRVTPARGSHFVLVTRGNVAAPTLEERTATGIERSQRTMSNPDLVVEVRDGRIYGVRAQLHEGP